MELIHFLIALGAFGLEAACKQLSLMQLQDSQPTRGLPATNNVTLLHVGLGVGIQNYTCADASAEPVSVGAIATLLDITSYLQRRGLGVSQRLGEEYARRYERIQCQEDPSNLQDNSCEQSVNWEGFPVLGKHYFSAFGIPTFQLTDGALLSAQEVQSVAPPPGSYAGANHTGAVSWLFLTADGSTRSHGLSEAYRINTAGGNATTCADAQASSFSEKYTAQYWVYQ